jgi:hypothetical protein
MRREFGRYTFELSVRPAPPRRILEPGDAARLAELRRQAMGRDRPQRPDRGHSIGM